MYFLRERFLKERFNGILIRGYHLKDLGIQSFYFMSIKKEFYYNNKYEIRKKESLKKLDLI